MTNIYNNTETKAAISASTLIWGVAIGLGVVLLCAVAALV